MSDKMPDEDQRQKLMPYLGNMCEQAARRMKGRERARFRSGEIEELKDVHLAIEDQ